MTLKELLTIYSGTYRVYVEVYVNCDEIDRKLLVDSEISEPDKALLKCFVLYFVARDNAVDIYL